MCNINLWLCICSRRYMLGLLAWELQCSQRCSQKYIKKGMGIMTSCRSMLALYLKVLPVPRLQVYRAPGKASCQKGTAKHSRVEPSTSPEKWLRTPSEMRQRLRLEWNNEWDHEIITWQHPQKLGTLLHRAWDGVKYVRIQFELWKCDVSLTFEYSGLRSTVQE